MFFKICYFLYLKVLLYHHTIGKICFIEIELKFKEIFHSLDDNCIFIHIPSSVIIITENLPTY